jgi:hypothetical protein
VRNSSVASPTSGSTTAAKFELGATQGRAIASRLTFIFDDSFSGLVHFVRIAVVFGELATKAFLSVRNFLQFRHGGLELTIARSAESDSRDHSQPLDYPKIAFGHIRSFRPNPDPKNSQNRCDCSRQQDHNGERGTRTNGEAMQLDSQRRATFLEQLGKGDPNSDESWRRSSYHLRRKSILGLR